MKAIRFGIITFAVLTAVALTMATLLGERTDAQVSSTLVAEGTVYVSNMSGLSLHNSKALAEENRAALALTTGTFTADLDRLLEQNALLFQKSHNRRTFGAKPVGRERVGVRARGGAGPHANQTPPSHHRITPTPSQPISVISGSDLTFILHL